MRTMLLLFSISVTSCFQMPSFLAGGGGTGKLLQGSNEVTIVTTEVEAEVVQAQVRANAFVTQTIPAATTGALAGAAVSFPPGALVLDSVITVQEGVSFIDDEVKSALGIAPSAISVASVPLVITTSAAQNPAKPFTLAIPLGKTGFLLDEGALAVMYVVNDYASGVQKTGIIPPADVSLKDGTAYFSGKYFGSYSLVHVSVEITAPLVAETAKQIITKSDKEKDATPPGSFTISEPSGNLLSPVRIAWSEASDAVTYGIRIGTDAKCDSFKVALRVGKVKSHEVSLEPGTYYICIKAFDEVDNATDAINSGQSFVVTTSSTGSGLVPPAFSNSAPMTPSEALAFTLHGSATGSEIEIFSNGACLGNPFRTDSVADFNTNGVPLIVSTPGSYFYSARSKSGGLVSPCSKPFVYSIPKMLPESLVGATNSIETTNGTQAGMLPNGRLVVGMNAGAMYNMEPHVVDLTTNTVTLLREINPNPAMGSDPRDFTYFNGYLYFTADDYTTGRELWRTDGTVAGTTLAFDINPGMGSNPSNLIVLNNRLFFSADDGAHGLELMSYDGINAPVVYDVYAGNSGSYYYGQLPVLFNNEVYFQAQTYDEGTELWKISPNSATPILVKDINPGMGPGSPHDLVVFNGFLYFTANDNVNGEELWRTDGTTAGTVLYHDFNAMPGYSGYPRATKVGSKLFIVANTGEFNHLLTFDGTAFSDIATLQYMDPAIVGTDQFFFFVQDTPSFGREIWRSDGTITGTSMLADLNPGESGIYGAQFKRVGSYVAFTFDAAGNKNLYFTNGTTAGTWRASSKSMGYAYDPIRLLGNMLIFPGQDAATGTELYHVFVNP